MFLNVWLTYVQGVDKVLNIRTYIRSGFVLKIGQWLLHVSLVKSIANSRCLLILIVNNYIKNTSLLQNNHLSVRAFKIPQNAIRGKAVKEQYLIRNKLSSLFHTPTVRHSTLLSQATVACACSLTFYCSYMYNFVCEFHIKYISNYEHDFYVLNELQLIYENDFKWI